MIGRPTEHRWLMKVAGILLKYYFLAWFCFTVLCLMLTGLGAVHLIGFLLVTVGLLLGRLAIFLFCFLAIAMIAEAWRYW